MKVWIKGWYKIKGVSAEISYICQALTEVSQQYEQNTTSVSFIDTSDNILGKNFDQLDPPFMYTQILKEILLTIKFEQQHITKFINYLYENLADNDAQLRKIKNLEEKYHDETPILWYSRESFLYPMLNNALRGTDPDVIIKMGFCIRDLHRHIEELHLKQFGGDNTCNILTLYRCQCMQKEAFKKMTKLKNGLIAFNNFLSTTMKEYVAHSFPESNLSNPDLIGIQFVMKIDPSEATIPFALINYRCR